MPFEILQVTASYSNAVLVAIMPHVSDFAKTLDLPVPQPVMIAQVRKFGCSPRADHIGGRVVLTNDYSFTFDLGAVVLYRSPHSYYSLQDPDRLSEFYGPVKVKKEEAVKIAHDALKKLGYADSELHLDLPPKVTPPKRNEGKEIACYLVEWINPDRVSPGGIPLERTAVEVNASNGRIEMLGIQNKEARRPDPKIAVHPPRIEAPPAQAQPTGGGVRVHPVGKAYADAFLVAILPQLSAFVEMSGIDVKVPISTNDVDVPNYDCGFVQGFPRACVYLKTGDRFWYEHGQVIEFDAHDSISWSAPGRSAEDKPHEKFYGPVKVSPQEALSVVRKVIDKAGYGAFIPPLKQNPEIVPPRKEGTNYFARYFFNWWPKDDGAQIAAAEVDATTKKLKSFVIDLNPKMWRDAPKVNVSPMLQTNLPRASVSAETLPPPTLPPATPIK